MAVIRNVALVVLSVVCLLAAISLWIGETLNEIDRYYRDNY